ncbi:MAG: ribosome biogenesis GTP-binding protein YsxC [Candidatus Moraniibacteriota bacterium]|nr:MAG: ribosome biogenesis GTP-binding protein YsxC [Candidatus Moranbacteria bacterium]
MEIRSATFIKGVIGSEGLPEPSRPTVAFFGRSNVGKSSVINTLTGQKDLAHANKRAGRTTEINYFLINDSWYLADLPGYGYANVPGPLRKKMAGYISWFAADMSIDIRAAVLIVDAEIGAKDSDRDIFRLLMEYGRPVIILANKCDKGRRTDVDKNIRSFETEFAPARVIRHSAKTGEGRSELLSAIFENKSA